MQNQPQNRNNYRAHATAESLEDVNCFFKPDTNSALSRHLSEAVWNEYKDQSCRSGVSFKTCVFSGVANLDSGIGAYAGSHDAYTTFHKLFDNIVQEYHGHGINDRHVSDMDASKLTNADFSAGDSSMVNSTRIRVGRNLAGYPLGPGVTKAQRLEIMNKVVEACSKFTGDLAGKFYPLEGMSKADQEQLIADHFLFKEGDRFLRACNLNRDWPSGRGIFHNDAKTFLVWVNEEDQLRIISMQPGAGIKEVFDRLSRAAGAIEKVAKFSRDDHLGYITSCPTNLGTALRASVHINLPKLMNNKAQFQAIADQYNVQIRGIHGEHTETNDGVFDISNKRRLGFSEASLVQDMIDGVRALIDAEKALGGGPKAQSLDQIVQQIREQLAAQGPRTLRSLTRNFTVTGPCGNRRAATSEFVSVLAALGVSLSDTCQRTLQAGLDKANCGQIHYDDFLVLLRGNMNQVRSAAVANAFQAFAGGSGSVNATELRARYASGSHPGVVSGAITADEAFLEFLASFSDCNNSGEVSEAEWYDYYAAVSSSVNGDSHFCQLVNATWGL